MKTVPRAEESKRVGIWIRVSTDDQARGESPEHHEARARMYADSRGWTVVDVYNLAGVSGKSVMDHPETKRMLKDMRGGRITGLIFSKLARLARNTRELLDFADLFKAAGSDLISLQEAIDTSTPAGRLFYTMIAAMATWEREEIGSRVAASVSVRAKLGKKLGGQAPFGYRYEGHELVPDPKEAPVVRRMYELFAEHGRVRTVCRLLNDAGHRMRKGAKFGYTTVNRLLTDSTPVGRHRVNYAKSLGDKKRWHLKPESEWMFHPVPPIVSDDLWNRVNATLTERRSTRKPPAKKAVQLFAGVVYCDCGGKMYVPANTPKYVCFACKKKPKNKIPITDLENVFQSQLRDFFFSPEQITEHLQSADSTLKEKGELLASIEAEQAKLRTEAEKLYQLYLADKLSVDSFGERHRPMEERLKQLGDEIPRLQGEIDFLKINYLSSSDVVAEAQDLYSRWPSLPFDEKRRVIENITEKIVVGDGDISLELCYLPSSAELLSKEHRNLRDSARRRG
jgi:site-specific DNA recombinase